MDHTLRRHRFTVDEYHRMAEFGVLGPDARVELLEGEVVDMAAIGSRHAACVDRIAEFFSDRRGSKFSVRVQGPVRIDEYTELQPDLALIRRRPDFYAERHPHPEDVALLVEVADSTVETDRDVKVQLYGRRGIRETWLVNLPDECIEVYSDPTEERGYWRMKRIERGESLPPSAFPEIEIRVEDILG